MSDDITFCMSDCDDMECGMNKKHIRHPDIPHSFAYYEGGQCCRKTKPTPELSPCPFCGGEAVIEKAEIEYLNYFARCTKCRVQTPWYASKKRLQEAWNRRVNDA